MSRFNYGCETICNENDIFPAMKQLVEEEDMSETAAGKFVQKDSGGQVTWRRARDAYRTRKQPDAIATKRKPKKKQTKPETKIQLDEIRGEMKAGNISDDDLKGMFDDAAEKITEGKIASRVASKLVTVSKKKNRDPSKAPKVEPQSEIKRLNGKLGFLSEQLQLLAEGSIKPVPGDQIYLKSIRMKGPSIIWSFHDLGIDIPKVYRLIVGRKELQNGEEAATEAEHFDVVETEGTVVN